MGLCHLVNEDRVHGRSLCTGWRIQSASEIRGLYCVWKNKQICNHVFNEERVTYEGLLVLVHFIII